MQSFNQNSEILVLIYCELKSPYLKINRKDYHWTNLWRTPFSMSLFAFLNHNQRPLECVTVEIRFNSGKFYEQQNTGRGHRNPALLLNVWVKQHIRLIWSRSNLSGLLSEDSTRNFNKFWETLRNKTFLYSFFLSSSTFPLPLSICKT